MIVNEQSNTKSLTHLGSDILLTVLAQHRHSWYSNKLLNYQ